MDKDHLQQAVDLIAKDFEIESGPEETMDEDALVRWLSTRIEWLIQYRMEYLLSLMYRLDVSEKKIYAALSPAAPDPPHIGISQLVVERQKQRLATKQAYPPKELGEDVWEE